MARNGGANVVAAILGLLALAPMVKLASGHDYGMALKKSILYFEAQRSGTLPPDQRVTWRESSGLFDGKANGVDLVGGYYDAGDNVKFGLPMAFTVTMMSWSILEYGKQMASAGELQNAMGAVKWGTDYFIKAHPEPDVLYGEVGDGDTDHNCWQRPEDMTTSRQAFRIDPQNPGSDLAGETAAAMAAASMIFRTTYPGYANLLLEHSKQLFQFADKYRGKYDSSITVARNYYGSFSGYGDELLWAAAWLFEATEDRFYLEYLATNGDALGGTGWSINQFGWDVKYPGVQVLAAKFLLQGRAGEHADALQRYRQNAEFFVCSCVGKGAVNVPRTPGGVMYHQRWNNLQFVTSASFLLTVYADYATVTGRGAVRCPAGAVQPFEILAFVKSQVNYILGDNPRGTSYMVGYGLNYPRQVHHRGASIVSIKTDPSFVNCQEGYSSWYGKQSGNPNLLEGAIVGGPDEYDDFADERNNYEQTEAATYNSAPLLGVLARLAGACGGIDEYHQSVPEVAPSSANYTLRPSHRHHHASEHLEIKQNVTRTWASKRRTYYRYSVTVTNRSRKTVRGLHLGISDLSGRLWGLDKARYGYVPQKWLPALRPGRSLRFGYVQPGPPANVWVTGYKLV
ncbi:endoglucanase 15 [Lolium perenne]|uniref:endoglucanase 15 n=1 Tax=Lolium perenne TaxID=4522 RepID=UPI0021F5D4DC|nr:endoglucanase 15-like [Lolium perenne]